MSKQEYKYSGDKLLQEVKDYLRWCGFKTRDKYQAGTECFVNYKSEVDYLGNEHRYVGHTSAYPLDYVIVKGLGEVYAKKAMILLSEVFDCFIESHQPERYCYWEYKIIVKGMKN